MNSNLVPDSTKKDLSLNSKIKEDFKEWLSSSTSHGLPNIARTDSKILRLVWFVSFLASTAACAYLLYLSVIGYLSFNVVTQISVYDELPSQFPTVTFCNSFPFSSENSTAFIQEKFKYYLQFDFDNFEFRNFLFTKYLILLSAADPSVSDDIKKSLGLTIDDMLINCQFSSNPCSKNDFEWFYSVFYGNCYRFNSGKNSTGGTIPIKYLNQAGKQNGLKLELYMGQNNKQYDFLNPSTGAHIIINNYTIMPTVFDGLDVSTSKETNIAVSRTLKYRLPSPYSDCIGDVYDETASGSFFFKSIVRSGTRYRFTDCINLCFLRIMNEKCGCYDLNIPNLYGTRPCVNYTDVGCDFYQFLDFFKHDIQETCGADCPVECNSEMLTFSTSFLEYPSEAYGNLLMNLKAIKSKFPNNSVTFEKLKQSTLALNVYYDNLKFTVIEESPAMDLITLISGMGGTLGLFIGVSFLSFVEILEILIRIFFIYHDHTIQKPNKVFDYSHKS